MHLAHGRRLCLKDRRHAGDLNGLGHGPDSHLEVEARDLSGFERNRRRRRWAEPGQLGFDDIGTDGERGDRVVARLVGHGDLLDVGRLVRRRDGDSRQRRAGFVDDEPGDRSGPGLGTDFSRKDEQTENSNCDAIAT